MSPYDKGKVMAKVTHPSILRNSAIFCFFFNNTTLFLLCELKTLIFIAFSLISATASTSMHCRRMHTAYLLTDQGEGFFTAPPFMAPPPMVPPAKDGPHAKDGTPFLRMDPPVTDR